MLKFLFFILIVFSFCHPMKNTPTLLEPPIIPANCIILYEQIACKEEDKATNYRFYLDQDGRFFHMKNDEIPGIENPGIWNKNFDEQPVRVLSSQQMSELKKLLSDIQPAQIKNNIDQNWINDSSHPVFERWTISLPNSNKPFTATLAGGSPPLLFQKLRTELDALVSQSVFYKK